MITEFTEHRVGTQPGSRQPLFNRLRGLAGDRHLFLTTRACVLHAIMLDGLQPSRGQFQLLAAVDADLDTYFATTRAGSFRLRKLVTNDLSVQVSGQLAHATPRAVSPVPPRLIVNQF